MSAAVMSKMVGAARLLASDKPGEAFAAIAAIDRLLPPGETLAGVVEAALTKAAPATVPVIPVSPSPAHRGKADACLAVLDLTDWERQFLATIRCKPRISSKQLAILAPLYARALEASYERR